MTHIDGLRHAAGLFELRPANVWEPRAHPD